MRLLLLALLAAFVLFAWPGRGGPEGPIPPVDLGVRVHAASRHVRPGEPFPLTVQRVWRKDLVPEERTTRDDILAAALAPLVLRLERTTRREDAARAMERRRYRAYAFTLDDVVIPAVRFEARPQGGGAVRSVASEPLALAVVPEVDPDAPGDAELPLPPLGEPPPRAPWIVLGALAALVVAVAAGRIRARGRARPAGPPTPPATGPCDDGEALGRLRALLAAGAGDEATRRRSIVEAAQAVRFALARRLETSLDARTSEEVAGLARHSLPGEGLDASLATVLLASDLVKFAAHTPTAAERARVLEAAVHVAQAATGGAP